MRPGAYFGLLTRAPTGATIDEYLPVVPMTLMPALPLVVSIVTPKPAASNISRYFDVEKSVHG